jgi:hypothetical protein
MRKRGFFRVLPSAWSQPFLNCGALEKSGGVFAPSTLTPVAVNLLAVDHYVDEVGRRGGTLSRAQVVDSRFRP